MTLSFYSGYIDFYYKIYYNICLYETKNELMAINKNLKLLENFLIKYLKVEECEVSCKLQIIIDTLDIFKCFDKEFFSITKTIIGNDKKLEIVEDVNKDNFFDKFEDEKQCLDWIIVVTQIKLFQRNEGIERWEVKFDNSLLNEIAKRGLFVNSNFFDRTIDFDGNANDYIAILGATYAAMKSRLDFVLYGEKILKNDEERLQTAKERISKNLREDGEIILLVGDRKINLSGLEINKNSIEELDALYSLDKDEREISISYKILKKRFLEENKLEISALQEKKTFEKFKQFLDKNKKLKDSEDAEEAKKAISEVDLGNYLIKEQRYKDVAERIKVIATEGENGKRPTTEDTVSNFLRNPDKKIDEHTKITFVSGQPNIISQKKQIKNLIKYNKEFEKIKLDNLSIIGKREKTTFRYNGKKSGGTLKSHLQAFGGALRIMSQSLKGDENGMQFNHSIIEEKYHNISSKYFEKVLDDLNNVDKESNNMIKEGTQKTL